MKFAGFLMAVVLGVAATTTSIEAKGTPTWGYRNSDNLVGPAEWATKFKTCNGTKQSPIDITRKAVKLGKRKGFLGVKGRDKPQFAFKGSCDSYELTASKYDYDAKPKSDECKLSSNNKTYSLAAVHFHTPSEHKIDGKALDGELHFVHKANGATSVVSVLLQAKKKVKTPSFLTKLWDGFDSAKSGKTVVSELGAYQELVMNQKKYGGIFNYQGSLTTPPCTEGVDWWVVRSPVKIAPKDLDKIKKLQKSLVVANNGANARPTQSLNKRLIKGFA